MSEITTEKELLTAAAKMFEKYGLTEIRLKSGDNEVYFKKETTPPMAACPPPMPPMGHPLHTGEAVGAVSAQAATADASAVASVSISTASDDASSTNTLKSPLLGIFYAAPDPESSPFVKVGDKVKKGDILCIVEAMKMMNEICAECDGTVVEICAENGSMVEFGQTLFKIRPAN